MNRKRTILRLIFLVAVFLVLAACNTADEVLPSPSMTPTTHVLPTEEDIPTVEETSAEPETTPAGEPSIPDAPLSTDGPWLVFTAADGIYAMNSDGSGMTRLLEVELIDWARSTLRASRQGGILAFTSPGERDFDIDLTIFSIPERGVLRTITLTSGIEAMPEGPVRDDTTQAREAVAYFHPFDLAPDGSQVAFMGVIDGPSSDLYVYDIAADTITRLTDGPAQGYDPHFSPDGSYIVHFSADSFGSGAGYSMDGAWAARADDSGVISLYDPSNQSAEEFVGWVDDSTFLVNSWNAGCGPNNLRTIDIDTLDISILWRHAFNDIIFNEESGTAAVAVDIDGERCNPEQQIGVFLIPVDGSPPMQILEEPGSFPAYHEPDEPIMLMTDVMTPFEVLPDGRMLSLKPSPAAVNFPFLSPDGEWAAWPGGGLWIGRRTPSGEEAATLVLQEGIGQAVWSPDSSAIFLLSNHSVHVAFAPDFVPILVVDNLELLRGTALWVSPWQTGHIK